MRSLISVALVASYLFASTNGAAQARPTTTESAPPASGPELVTADPEVRFFRRSGQSVGEAIGSNGFWATAHSESYDDLCGSPCKAPLSPGRHTLALSRGDGAPVAGEPVTIPAGPSKIEGTYVSHLGRRIAALVIMAAGVGIGTAFLASGLSARKRVCESNGVCDDRSAPDYTQLGIGAGSFVAGLVTFAILNQKDSAEFRVIPGVAAALGARKPFEQQRTATAPGLTLSMTW